MIPRPAAAPLNRGELMRQIAALYAQITIGFGKERQQPLPEVERQELLRQIVALKSKLRR